MIVIGDIHGCYNTLLALISQIRIKYPDEQICLVGDLIDRGPRSYQVVQYVIDNQILCVRGNHEDMMIDSILNNINDPDWERNGGRQTVESYPDKTLMIEHANWMNRLPLFLSFPDCKKDNRHLVVSHSNIGKVWDWSETRRKEQYKMFANIIMWGRNQFEDRSDIYNIVGHTPVLEPRITSFYANVDTGAVFKKEWIKILGAPKPSYGTMTAIHFPSMELFTQENIEKNL